MSEHPMDQIPVRKLRFDFSEGGKDSGCTNPVWSQSSPDFSIFINALGVHVPHFERFLVRAMREYRDGVADQKLLDDIKAIIGQEAHHAFNFVNWTEAMCARYPGLAEIDAHAKTYFEDADKHGKKFRVGFTAGYETFTFLAGMIILDRYEELMAEADPTLRALWVWHQVEEVEHGAVAFEYFQALYPGHEWYRRAMILFAFGHISWETFKAYRVMLKGEGFSLKRKLKAWQFFFGFAGSLFWASLPVFSSTYHPREHPICNESQNRIAVAWRAFHAAGKDTQRLDQSDMQTILEMSHAH